MNSFRILYLGRSDAKWMDHYKVSLEYNFSLAKWLWKLTSSFLSFRALRNVAVVFLITSILNLCAVSYDRLTAIVMPMESRITMRGAKIIMILTWIAGLGIALPVAIYRYYKVSIVGKKMWIFRLLKRINGRTTCLGTPEWKLRAKAFWAAISIWFVCAYCFLHFSFVFVHFRFHVIRMQERQWKNYTEKFCGEDITILPMYWHVILMVLVLFPLTVMIICYSAIFWKVTVGNKQIKAKQLFHIKKKKL